MVLLLICADGMRHGRRLALRIAISVQLAVTALAAVYLALFARIPHYPNRPRTAVMGSGFVHVLPLVAVPLLLVVLLWLNRRQFRVETAPAGPGRSLAWWSAAPGSCSPAPIRWLAGRRRDGPRRRECWAWRPNSPGSTCRCPFQGPTAASSRTANAVEAFLFASAGIIFWGVALAAVWLVLRRRLHRSPA